MTNVVYVPDIVEANGKTVRENNLELPHKIPLKTFVEINLDYSKSHGCRGFVVEHRRDCDGTPLYGLSLSPDDADHIANMKRSVEEGEDQAEAWLRLAQSRVNGGWSDSCLIVIDNKEKSRDDRIDTVFRTLDQFPVLSGRVTKYQAEQVITALGGPISIPDED